MSVLYIPIVAILMPLVLVPTTLFMKHRHQRRKWEHLERLKSIEVQMPMPMRQALGGAAGIATIGAGVPVVSVLGALLDNPDVAAVRYRRLRRSPGHSLGLRSHDQRRRAADQLEARLDAPRRVERVWGCWSRRRPQTGL